MSTQPCADTVGNSMKDLTLVAFRVQRADKPRVAVEPSILAAPGDTEEIKANSQTSALGREGLSFTKHVQWYGPAMGTGGVQTRGGRQPEQSGSTWYVGGS